jgi:hypothetical protein
MKKAVFLCILFFIHAVLIAQNDTDSQVKSTTNVDKDTIQIINNGKGIHYLKDRIILHYKDIDELLSKNESSKTELKVAKNYNLASSVLAIGGSGFVLIGIATYISYDNSMDNRRYGDPKPVNYSTGFLAIGFGALIATIPFIVGSKLQLLKAVKSYNHSLNSTTTSQNKLYLGPSTNGLGFRLIF